MVNLKKKDTKNKYCCIFSRMELLALCLQLSFLGLGGCRDEKLSQAINNPLCYRMKKAEPKATELCSSAQAGLFYTFLEERASR